MLTVDGYQSVDFLVRAGQPDHCWQKLIVVFHVHERLPSIADSFVVSPPSTYVVASKLEFILENSPSYGTESPLMRRNTRLIEYSFPCIKNRAGDIKTPSHCYTIVCLSKNLAISFWGWVVSRKTLFSYPHSYNDEVGERLSTLKQERLRKKGREGRRIINKVKCKDQKSFHGVLFKFY